MGALLLKRLKYTNSSVKGSRCKVYIHAILLFSYMFLVSRAQGRNYYLNSISGSDSNTGRSIASPWRSLQMLSDLELLPGDSILFARGSAFNGGVKFQGSGNSLHPIVITCYDYGKVNSLIPRHNLDSLFRKYGAGAKPAFSNPQWSDHNGNVLQIKGSYYKIEQLYFHDNARPPGSDTKNKNVQKMGAVYLALDANYNTISHCEFFHTPVAIKVKGSYNLIENNYFHDANKPLAQSWGPIAIMIVKPHNEICYNRIENYGSYGGPYGSDGGVVELDGVDDDFVGRDILIHHNISINNQGFLELAGRNVDSVLVAYNLSDDMNQFIGGGSMKNVTVVHNTVIRTREPNVDRYIFWTFQPDATFMTIRNNIFVIAADISVFGVDQVSATTSSGISKLQSEHAAGVFIKKKHVRSKLTGQVHDHNLYFSPGNPYPIGSSKGEGELIADPQFIDPTNGNFRLKPTSIAIKRGTEIPVENSKSDPAALKLRFDLDGHAVRQNGPSCIGAYEL